MKADGQTHDGRIRAGVYNVIVLMTDIKENRTNSVFLSNNVSI